MHINNHLFHQKQSCLHISLYFIIYGFFFFHYNFLFSYLLLKLKSFYTRGTLKHIRISWFAKISTLYCDWLRSLKLEKWSHLSCIKGKGAVKTFTVLQRIALFLSLYYKISFIKMLNLFWAVLWIQIHHENGYLSI